MCFSRSTSKRGGGNYNFLFSLRVKVHEHEWKQAHYQHNSLVCFRLKSQKCVLTTESKLLVNNYFHVKIAFYCMGEWLGLIGH